MSNMDHRASDAAAAPIGQAAPSYAAIAANLDGLGAAIDARLSELAAAKKRIAVLEAAMTAVVDELEEDFDINDNDGPNKAMRLANELNEALYGPGGF